MRDRLDYATWATAALIAIPFAVFTFPQFIGFSDSYIVKSNSMTPEISPGDLVFIGSANPSDISKGDVITFQEGSGSDEVMITHRVSEIQRFEEETQFLTKGDSNPEADPEWVADYEVAGKVGLLVPRLGRIVEVANVGVGRIAVILIPSMLLLLNELRNIMKSVESNERFKTLVKQ